MSVYNPLARSRSLTVTVPLRTDQPGQGNRWAVLVQDVANSVGQWSEVKSQTTPVPGPVLRAPGRDSRALYNLNFLAEDLPPLQFKQFKVTSLPNNKRDDVNKSGLKWNYSKSGVLTLR